MAVFIINIILLFLKYKVYSYSVSTFYSLNTGGEKAKVLFAHPQPPDSRVFYH